MKIVKIGMAAFAAMAVVQAGAMSLADASAKLTEAASNAATMVEVIKQLSPSDQTAFLSKVNATIASFPGSDAEKGVKYLNAAKAALAGAEAKNRTAVLAEIFATVPPEYLTVINERLAEDTFSRDADPTNPVSDDEMKRIALDVMKVVKERCAGADNENVRDAFAALVFIRASKGTPADLRDALIDTLPAQESRNLARKEWFPAALGEGREKSYEPMLAVVNDVKFEPFDDGILGLANNSVFTGALLADLSASIGDNGNAGTPFSDAGFGTGEIGMPTDMSGNGGMSANPTSIDDNPYAPYNPNYRRGGGSKGSETAKDKIQEVDDYTFQESH